MNPHELNTKIHNLLISETILNEFSIFLESHFALHFPKDKYRDLERGIIKIMDHKKMDSPLDLIQQFKANTLTAEEIEIITSEFTVGETYFFREPNTLEALKQSILPNLIEERRKTTKTLRIWSAGCSTGEEPYTIVLILSELIPDWKDWNITVLATDINVNALNRVKEGVYSDWSFRNVPTPIKDQYFKTVSKNKHAILTKFKNVITPFYLNLALDPFPNLLNDTNAMDIIFCRNLLMYFSKPFIDKVVGKFRDCLVEEGLLVVGASETSLIPTHLFKTLHINNAVLFRKSIPEIESVSSLPSVPLSQPKIVSKPKIQNIPRATQTVSKPVLKKKSEKLESPEQLARQFANQGDLKKALEWVEKGIQADKINPLLHYLKALIMQESGDISGAIDELNKAIYLDHNFVLGYFSLGNLNRLQNKQKDAHKNFSIVLQLLTSYQPDDLLPGGEGITAGRLKATIGKTDPKVSKNTEFDGEGFDG